MTAQERERERRRQRLRLFTNNNQWIKNKTLEQTLEEMSSQLREYRKDLQRLRLQEAATEAKIDRLDRKIQNIESVLRGSGTTSSSEKTASSLPSEKSAFATSSAKPASTLSSEKPASATSPQQSSLYSITNEGHTASYCEKGTEERTYPHFTINMYA